VRDRNLFRPHGFSSNRTYHREFWSWVPPAVQESHIRRSQEILQQYFEVPVVTFVPPGNVCTEKTLEIAERHGLRYVSCDAPPGRVGGMKILEPRDVIAFHDRYVVLKGVGWLQSLIARDAHTRFCPVANLATVR
jgi:peptidoglycan/xylan/chitin deacetylase (PgdA/CDA1 family)